MDGFSGEANGKSYIPKGMTIIGDVESDGDLKLSGEVMGNVDIDCMKDKDSYSISAKTDLGEIRVDGHKEGRNYKNAVEDGIPIKAEAKMGNVEIDF